MCQDVISDSRSLGKVAEHAGKDGLRSEDPAGRAPPRTADRSSGGEPAFSAALRSRYTDVILRKVVGRYVIVAGGLM